MVLRLTLANVAEAHVPRDENLLQGELREERDDEVSSTTLRDGRVGERALRSAKQVVAANPALDLILQEIVKQARLATSATGAFIATVRAHEIVCHATSGCNAAEFVGYLNRDRRMVDCCLRTTSPQCCADSEAAADLDAMVCRNLGARSIVIVPILETRKEPGIFGVFSFQPDSFSSVTIAALQSLSRRIADAMAQVDRCASVSPSDTRTPVQPNQGKRLVSRAEELLRGLVRLPAPLRWPSLRLLGLVAVSVMLSSLIVELALNQRAIRTSARRPATVASRGVSSLSALALSQDASTNAGGNAPSAGTVKTLTAAPALHMTSPKKPSRPRRQVPDLEIENALDDTSSAPFLSESAQATKTPDQASADVGRSLREAGRKVRYANAGSLSASPVMVAESIALDHLVERVKPDYPQEARVHHVEGAVIVDVVVGRDGQVESVRPVEGDSRLLASAAKAVGLWRFTPLVRNGRLVSFESHITLHFSTP